MKRALSNVEGRPGLVVAMLLGLAAACGDGGGEADGTGDAAADADGDASVDVLDGDEDVPAEVEGDAEPDGDDVEVGDEADGDGAEAATSGEFTFVTYNVAGLPEGMSGSHPATYIPLISPLLDAYDLIVVQEDFWYHDALAADVTLPYRSDPMVDPPSYADMGDGLNRFATFPFAGFERTTWAECNGTLDCSSDCLTRKGFSYGVHELAPGREVHVYNLHMDAGSCAEDLAVRSVQGDQLIAAVLDRSAGAAVIVAGDTNLQERRPEDMVVLTRILDELGLSDACRTLGCGEEAIDRVLFRGSASVALTPLEWSHPAEFVDGSGNDLSDHEPVAVRFSWSAE